MDSRASTTTRLSVIPVLIALALNLVAPVLSVAVPEVTPTALRPQVTEAASDPIHVSFTLEGCRLENGAFIEATVTCEDVAYTSGNLGKEWNELDLVPYRLTTEVGNQADATTTYTFGITADHMDAGHPGYDVLSAPVVNTALSDDSCQVTSGPEQVITPGVGGIEESLGRLVTITQDKGTTCVIDWYERLALGSHLFPGSSLHTNRTNQQFSTSGIGAADVSIPVNEILPQELAKTMTATVGQTFAWDVAKTAEPTTLDFENTCLDTPEARSQDVQITVTWTRSGPTSTGATTITTQVTAINPAHRTITVQATDKIYEGATQTTLLDSVTGLAVDVPANTSMLVLEHTFVYNGSATTFNDVATATYTDKLTGIPVPGQTQATASATATPAGGAPAQSTVVVSDTESITGTGLAFSVAAPSVGAFTNYTAGTSTTGPVNWAFTATNSGSVTFNKTVTVDEPRITSGTLSDTATITGDGQSVLDTASANVGITTDALVELDIDKTIPAGSLRAGESVTFDFEITGPNGFSDTASITINFGSLSGSTTLTGLEAGQYTVHEVPQANWADHSDQQTTIALPDCDGSVSFNNSTLAPSLSIAKEADESPVSAGDDIGFSIVVSNDDAAGTGVAQDVTLNDPLPGSLALGVSWTLDDVLFNGVSVADPDALCAITGAAPTQTLTCAFGDLDPGDSYEVQISSETSAPDGCENVTLPNTATADASNHDEIEASASIVVECPDLDIVKEAAESPVSVGEDIGFTITVTNSDADGTGTATNVTLNDPLPGSAALGVDWSLVSVALNGADVLDPNLFCEITGTPPAETLECEFGDLEPGDSASVTVSSPTSAPEGDCETATLLNVGTADADNHAEITASDSIVIECPGLNLTKEADETPIVAGEEASFTIHLWNAGPGDALGVTLHDDLPPGVAWDFEILNNPASNQAEPCGMASSLDQDNVVHMSIDCDFGTLGVTSMEEGIVIRVFGITDGDDCEGLENNVEASGTNLGAPLTAVALIEVRCPTLVIDKVADVEEITISGPENAPVADPSIVTWTLTYTLTDGPVTNAVITDEVPEGFVFLDASDGGQLINGAVTWTFPELTTSGFVTFRTTVDVETISLTGPTVNVAIIDSDETEPDEGEDSVTVVREGTGGGNPSPSVPDTAAVIGPNGEPITVPVELLVALFLGSLGAMALANVRARNRRR